MNRIFEDRAQAGRLLATQLNFLSEKEKDEAVILALPRGGVPVAYEISQTLGIPLDVLISRKIGHPLQPEYGIGAMTEGGFYWMDPDAVGVSEITASQINHLIEKENKEIQRRVSLYRKGRPLPLLRGKTIILVDDGLATGVTARVAAKYIKSKGAAKVILAVPVCSDRTAEKLRKEVDEVVCLNESSIFFAVGHFYRHFDQLKEEEVLELLSSPGSSSVGTTKEVTIYHEDGTRSQGFLSLPPHSKGIILFAHGSGSGRFSERNQFIAELLNQKGFGTLLFDLLTKEESENRALIFDIPLLAKRLISATKWIRQQDFGKKHPLGYLGASTGGGAALWAAAELKNEIRAVVSRGGRPDLAIPRLKEVTAPTLLLVGDNDNAVIPLNEESLKYLKEGSLVLIPGATHLFEEPGTLEQAAEQAIQWFEKHLDKKNIPLMPTMLTIDEAIEQNAVPLRNRLDMNALIKWISQSKIVMLGEATHGTQEFYEWRRLISQELIAHYGFNFIAVEGDWPPCSALNRFIHHKSPHEDATLVLEKFQRWPTWMWANTEIVKLAQWLKKYNQTHNIGFYGLDVYSLFESIDEVIKQLQTIDPSLARRVQVQYECLDPFQRNEKAYVKYLTYFPNGCEAHVLNALKELLKIRIDEMSAQEEHLLDAQQNARIVKNAENYYRAMLHGDENSWNVRDRHMMETLDHLLSRYGSKAKAIVWAHNTHIGDYRATDMVNEGQINIGGLAREKWGEEKVSLIGFGTYQGEVIASHAWDGPTEIMTVPPARPHTYEAYFHLASKSLHQNAYYLWFKGSPRSPLNQVLGHRAIGVVYHPSYERYGNYVPTSLSQRYDGFIFIDKTRALIPLVQKFSRGEIPETWPRGV